MGPIVQAAFAAEIEKIGGVRRAARVGAAFSKAMGAGDVPAVASLLRPAESAVNKVNRRVARYGGESAYMTRAGLDATQQAKVKAEGAMQARVGSALSTPLNEKAFSEGRVPEAFRRIAQNSKPSPEVRQMMRGGGPKIALASARGPGIEKIAAIWGCALPSPSYCGPGGNKRWSDRFTDTPFLKQAQAIEKAEAQKEINYAEQAVESAQHQVKEAQFRAKVAGLESKLLNWKAEQGGEKAKVAMQEKLASCMPCCMSGGSSWEWSDNFKTSPFYKEAVQMDAEDARMNVERTERSIKDSQRWRGEDENRVERAKLEASYAEWRVKNLS